MTFKEFKNCCKELKELNNNVFEIRNNDDLSKNEQINKISFLQPRINELNALLIKHSSLFNTTTKDFEKHLQTAFEKDYPNLTVSAYNICDGFYYEKEYFEGIEKYFTGKKYINLTICNEEKEKSIKLLEKNISTNYNYDTDFILGKNKINVMDLLETLLANNSIDYSTTIEEACWLVAEQNHKAICEAKLPKVNKKRKSLIRKRYEYLDAISRLNKINSLSYEINELDNEIKKYSNNIEDVEI